MNARTTAQALTIQYGYTGFVFGANLKGMTDEDGLKQPATGGNCLNWVVGHIVGSRGGTLQVLGQDPPFAADKYERYKRGSKPVVDGEGTLSLADMMEDFAATAPALEAGLGALKDELLAGKAPFSPGENPEETVGSLLVGLAFHEAYHCGQLGVLRRMAGGDGIIP